MDKKQQTNTFKTRFWSFIGKTSLKDSSMYKKHIVQFENKKSKKLNKTKKTKSTNNNELLSSKDLEKKFDAYFKQKLLKLFSDVDGNRKKESSKIKLSIVIPNYNRVASLIKCLNSIAVNDYPQSQYEVLVIDDCSTENMEKIRNYENIKNFKFYSLLFNSKGAAAPRNYGLHCAIGKYILFIDSDDKISPRFISTAMAIAEKGKCDTVIVKKTSERQSAQWYSKISKNIESIDINKKNKEWLINAILGDVYVIGRLYRTDLIRQFGLRFPEHIKRGEGTVFNRLFGAVLRRVGICVSETYYLTPAGNDNLSLNSPQLDEIYNLTTSVMREVLRLPNNACSMTRKVKILNLRFKNSENVKLLDSSEHLALIKNEFEKTLFSIKDSDLLSAVSLNFVMTVLYGKNWLQDIILQFASTSYDIGNIKDVKVIDIGRVVNFAVTTNNGKYFIKTMNKKNLRMRLENEILVIKTLNEKGIDYVSKFIERKDGAGIITEINNNYLISVQEYIDGDHCDKNNTTPNSTLLQGASLLGKIHQALKDIKLSKIQFQGFQAKNDFYTYAKKAIMKNAVENQQFLLEDISLKLKIMKTTQNIEPERLTWVNGHADYVGRQFITNKNKIIGIIDWTEAASIPAICELVMYYVLSAKECGENKIRVNMENFVKTVKEYLKYIELNKYDLKMMFKYNLKFFVNYITYNFDTLYRKLLQSEFSDENYNTLRGYYNNLIWLIEAQKNHSKIIKMICEQNSDKK